MNGDPRVFAPQLAAFPNLTVPCWERPVSEEEPLADYAQRLAAKIDPGNPCVIGGVSFGGIVALEVAKHLRSEGCVLIACCRHVEGLPLAIKMLRPVSTGMLGKLIRRVGRLGHAATMKRQPGAIRRFAEHFPSDLAFRHWAIQVLLTWQPSLPDCPIQQIHGSWDSTFPAKFSGADCIVPEAGHLLTITHADAVNEYLRNVLTSLSSQSG